MVVFIQIFNQRWDILSFSGQQDCSGFDVKRLICEAKGITNDDIYITHNGCILDNTSKLDLNQNDIFLQCNLRLPGGKGGFGSMLRAIGAQIEKTTNREACRDLSGRRMRDVNDEKKIADWLSKQAERDQEKARRKQQRLERLQTEPKHVFEEGTKYTSQLQENMDSIDDALKKGLQSSSSGQSSSSLGKRKVDSTKTKKSHKKQKLWLDMGEDLSSDSGEESDNISSCSSMAYSDYSIPESSGKGSSTTTTGDLPSGNTSENENSSLCGESPACSSKENLVSTKPRFELHEQPNESAQKDTAEIEESVKAETDKQDASPCKEASTHNASTISSKGRITKQDTTSLQSIASENIAKSQDNGCNVVSETCSNDLASSAIDTDRKCEDLMKEKDEPSSGQSGSVHSTPSSNSVTLPLNLDEYSSTAEVEALGLDVLKSALMSLGLKCGGTLKQRAERLFSIKGIAREKIDLSLFAKQSGKKEKKR